MHTADPPERTPPGAGHSSFELIDAGQFLAELQLTPGLTVADLGCGEGHYTFALADAVGEKGLVYALDLWQPGLEALECRAAAEGRKNLKTYLANISRSIPLPDGSVDLALMATVLHDLAEFDLADGALKETARVLKPGGALAIVEFKKVAGPPGPPLTVRLGPEEVAVMVAPHGFKQARVREVGPYNYLTRFIK